MMSPLLAKSQLGLIELHSSNNGPGDSIRSLCVGVGCNCTIPSGGSVGIESLQEIQTSKKHQKSHSYKTKKSY